jgi:hypothetical protein
MRHGLGLKLKPFFPERLFGKVEHVYGGTSGYTNVVQTACTVGAGQGWSKAKTALQSNVIRSSYSKNTCSYAYVRSIGRPNYGDCQPYI